MSFWRSWTARLLGATGAALLVPVGLVLTVVVAAAVAGGGGFGGLAQLTRGPEIPGVAGDGPTAAAPLDGGLAQLPPAVSGRSRAGSDPGPAAATATTAGAARTTTPRTTTTAPETTTSIGVTVTTITAGPGTTTTATTPPSTAKPAAPRPNPLREVVRTVQGVVEVLPVLGPPVSDAVGSVADLILPPLGRMVAADPVPAE